MDVIILGGGIVGLTLANLLSNNNDLQIALIEQHVPTFAWDTNTYDLRCSAITRASQQVFMHLDIWKEIIGQRVGIYDQVIVWEEPDKVQLNFSAKSIGEPNLGHIIENSIIARALYKRLQGFNNVKIIKAVVKEISHMDAYTKVFIDDYFLQTKLLVGADGKNSWLRQKLNIPVYKWGDESSAIVAVIKTQISHNNTAWQRFLPEGPLAFLPLDEPNLCSIVWANTNANVRALMQLSTVDFSTQLAKAFNFKLGGLELHSERASFPVGMIHASKYIENNCVLIGDAAHAVHPLAGQGLNLGIMDAWSLAKIIQQSMANNKSYTDYAALRKYERERKAHNMEMLALVTSLKKLFANQNMVGVRKYGLQLINNFTWCKNKMMHYALGV